MWNGSFHGGEVERKISPISSHGTTRSTVFWPTKRGTERLVPSHVPNAPWRTPIFLIAVILLGWAFAPLNEVHFACLKGNEKPNFLSSVRVLPSMWGFFLLCEIIFPAFSPSLPFFFLFFSCSLCLPFWESTAWVFSFYFLLSFLTFSPVLQLLSLQPSPSLFPSPPHTSVLVNHAFPTIFPIP